MCGLWDEADEVSEVVNPRALTPEYWEARRWSMHKVYERRRREKDTPEAFYRRERFGPDRGIASPGVPR